MVELSRIIGFLLLVGSGSAWIADVYAQGSDDGLPPNVLEQPGQLELDDPSEENSETSDQPDSAMPEQPLPESAPPAVSEEGEDGSEFAFDLPPDPDLRQKMLDELYARLSKAKDAKSAEPIMQSIEHLWRATGSPTIDLLIDRAKVFGEGADPDLSIEILGAAADLTPDIPEIWYQRGRLYAARQDYARAESDFRKALSLDPKHYKAWRELSQVLSATGNKQGADEALEKASKINPFLDQVGKKPVETPPPDDEGRDI
jgi:tetratricopeptide (TPR) repeat protein